VLAHDRRGIVAARGKRGYDARIRGRVAERDGDVEKATFVARPADRAARRACLPFGFRPAEQFDQAAAIERVAGSEIGNLARLRELVPWTEQLAVVAAEDPVADRCT